MREWKKIVSEQENGKKLEQILKDSGFSKKEISRLKFRNPGISVDGKKCRSTEVLRIGQEISLYLEDREIDAAYLKNAKHEKDRLVEESEESLETGRVKNVHRTELEILYEDEDLVIVSKPSGLSCHPGKGHYYDNLGSMVLAHCRKLSGDFLIREIGRLDKDTSGGMVFAKNRNAAARVWSQKEIGTFYKKYLVLVHGKVEECGGTLDLPMEEVPNVKNRMTVCTAGMKAVTNYEVIRYCEINEENYTLLKCSLETGRTHQIRVHMAAFGHPVAGDQFYGIKDGIKRLCLHAGELELLQPFSRKKIHVEIPVKGIPFE